MSSKKNKENEQQNITDELLKKLSEKRGKKIYATSNIFRLRMFHFFHRFWHIIFSLPFLLATLLLHFLLLLRWLLTRKPIFTRREVYGKKGKIIQVRYFNSDVLSNLALFYHLFSGKLSLTGYSLNLERAAGDAFIYDYTPGIVNLWYIRSASRTAYEGNKETDKEYIRQEILKAELKPGFRSYLKLLKAEFLLIVRFMIAIIYRNFHSGIVSIMFDPIFLFNTRLCNITMKEALGQIKAAIINQYRRKIYFVNPDCFNRTFASQFADYRQILHKISPNDLIFADGIGINIAEDIMGYPKNENINGTDLFPRLCELAAAEAFSLYLLGAKPGVAETLRANVLTQYPGLKIVGVQNGYFDWEKESSRITSEINKQNPDILLVALGAPYQERWIEENFENLNCPVLMGVGGLFDFYSGKIKRAPRWMRDIGLEWVFRLLKEPGRMFNRYIIGNPLFLHRVHNLKRACTWLISKKIKKLRRKNSQDILDLTACSYFLKRHAELLDIMPLLFNFCARENIPLILNWQQNSLESIAEKLKNIFPELKIFCQQLPAVAKFSVIIADKKPEPDEQPSASLWLIDPRFCSEISRINILSEN